MGRPGQFPTHNGADEHTINSIEQKITGRLAPLAEGTGRLVLLLIPDRHAFASSRKYRTEGGLRQLFVITEDSNVIAYMDVGLDTKARMAVCQDTRNPRAPVEFGDLNRLGSSNDGFACENPAMGELLMGLTLYALKSDGVAELKVVGYTPNQEVTDAFSLAGPQRSDFQTHIYHHVPDVVRDLVAESLRISG